MDEAQSSLQDRNGTGKEVGPEACILGSVRPPRQIFPLTLEPPQTSLQREILEDCWGPLPQWEDIHSSTWVCLNPSEEALNPPV